MPRPTISAARFPEDLAVLRDLFRAYETFLGFSLCFQGFDEELATLPGKYAPPLGGCWIAWQGEKAVGCVALRPLRDAVGEVKRLFVLEEAKGQGIGRKLMEKVIAEARIRNYHELWLDTVSRLTPALKLYESMGFREIAPYNSHAEEDVCYRGLYIY